MPAFLLLFPSMCVRVFLFLSPSLRAPSSPSFFLCECSACHFVFSCSYLPSPYSVRFFHPSPEKRCSSSERERDKDVHLPREVKTNRLFRRTRQYQAPPVALFLNSQFIAATPVSCSHMYAMYIQYTAFRLSPFINTWEMPYKNDLSFPRERSCL